MKNFILYVKIVAIVIVNYNSIYAQHLDTIIKLPSAKSPRSHNIDIKHITLNLKFDWQNKQTYGTVTIKFAPLSPLNLISLDAASLTINSISLANGSLLKFNYDGSGKDEALKINLNRIYETKEEITIVIDYHTNWINQLDPNFLNGSNGKGLRFSEPSSNDPVKPKEIWSIGEAESNRYWFPCYDYPNDLRTTEFIATVDKKLSVISNGNLIQIKDNTDGTRTFYWKTEIPYANHLTSFVVGEFVNTKQNYNGIELDSYGHPNETNAVVASVERLPDMIKFFSEKIDAKYPYPSYSQVFVQDLPNYLTNNMFSTITENMIDDDRTHADYFYLWDLTEAEALASQWFGSYLTIKDWSDIWLNKGFSTYFSCLYNEYKNGRDEFLIYQLSYFKSIYFNDWSDGTRRPIITKHFENAQLNSEDNYPPFRGAMVLHMLRKHLGEELWWRAIKLYIHQHANTLVSTQNFQKAVEEACGEPMDWFFEQWLYKIGHPIFKISKKYDGIKKELIISIKQTQKKDSTNLFPQVNFFKGKIDIEIDNQIKEVWLDAKDENVFSFNNEQEPKLVNVDYESTWIKEVEFEKELDELLYQFKNDKDILAKQWALNELILVSKSEKTKQADIEKITNALRDELLSNSHWRFKIAVLSQLRLLIAKTNGTSVPLKLDRATTETILTLIKTEKSWLKTSAIFFLGTTLDSTYADLYISHLNDKSDRVINASAIALGKTKSAKAFDALAKLKDKPSWKNQSLMSTLAGLKELNDPRGFDIAYEALLNLNLLRWRLPTFSVWDLRVFAAQTIASLGRGEDAYPLLFDRFTRAINENNTTDIFNNALLIATLAAPKGQEAFDVLKKKYKDDENALLSVNQMEEKFKETIKKQP